MKNLPPKLLLFTDLDGTLLDSVSYSCEIALPAINHLKRNGIPVVFCSAKTRAEQEVYRTQLRINDPFIVENGSAIFISQGYFPFHFCYQRTWGSFQIIELGSPYSDIRRILKRIRTKLGVGFKGFGDMSAEEVAIDSGLGLEAARLAKEREYDETIKLEGTPFDIERVLRAVTSAGLKYAYGGRYYGITQGSDKGSATAILIDLFRKKMGRVRTVGIGDSINDLSMLSVVDIPILVQRPGSYWEEIDLPKLKRVKGIGPKGWNEAVQYLLDCINP